MRHKNNQLTHTSQGDWQKVTDIMGHANMASTKARWNELTRKLKTQSTTNGTPEPKTPKKTPAKRKTASTDDGEAETPTTKRKRKPTTKAEGGSEDAVVKEEGGDEE